MEFEGSDWQAMIAPGVPSGRKFRLICQHGADIFPQQKFDLIESVKINFSSKLPCYQES
jgi:hypothetical protein